MNPTDPELMAALEAFREALAGARAHAARLAGWKAPAAGRRSRRPDEVPVAVLSADQYGPLKRDRL